MLDQQTSLKQEAPLLSDPLMHGQWDFHLLEYISIVQQLYCGVFFALCLQQKCEIYVLHWLYIPALL